MYDNKKIFILGMARSGYECAKFLINKNCDILITDRVEQDLEHVNYLKSRGVDYVITDTPEELLNDSFDYVVKNPGIRIDHEVCLKAEKLNIPVINEQELAFTYLPKDVKIIGITGSNGKTTTTTITYEILKAAGFSVHIGGNIGIPMCAMLENINSGDIVVMEISCQQLHDFNIFKTDISVLTNLIPVHIDHLKTYENYMYTKSKIFNHHTKNNIAILNMDNADVLNITTNIESTKMFFSSKEETDICIIGNDIYYKNERIIDLDRIRVKGVHNYENIMCAIGVAKQFDVSNQSIIEVLEKFSGVEHRIEFVKKINEREFYNDSKSTNTKATQIALSSFSKPTILLLGGLDRGHSFDELKPCMENVKSIICYGETKNRIKEFADNNNIDCLVTDDLEEATKISFSISEENDIILLSPACASWDQFESFEKRGEAFKKYIENIGE